MVATTTGAGSGLTFAAIAKRIERQESFLEQLAQEWRRAERSRRPFLLVLFESKTDESIALESIAQSIAPVIRETDVWGWYKAGVILGAIFTELGDAPIEEARKSIVERINTYLQESHLESLADITISSYALPVEFSGPDESGIGSEDIHSVLGSLESKHKFIQLGVKRLMDIVGAGFLLLVFLPLLLVIAVLVKCTSRGPALFRQTRVGQRGKHFTFLKFRSMAAGNSSAIHEEYCREFINGKAEKLPDESGKSVFKLTGDPRITPIGKFLRKTSLDELPQLWNVFCGDMSLVGPRPPIPYEVAHYDFWHRRRVLEVKPGLTGLWQVSGRNRTTFNEMVRLDLRYANQWSLWLDFKILLETPYAVLNGAH